MGLPGPTKSCSPRMRKHVNKQSFLGNHAGSIQAAVLIGHSDLASRMRLTGQARICGGRGLAFASGPDVLLIR
jgi:hypothetical protein